MHLRLFILATVGLLGPFSTTWASPAEPPAADEQPAFEPCGARTPLAMLVQQHPLVFLGVVTAVRRKPYKDNDPFHSYETGVFTVRPVRFFAGARSSSVKLSYAQSMMDDMSGYGSVPEPGDKYIVYFEPEHGEPGEFFAEPSFCIPGAPER